MKTLSDNIIDSNDDWPIRCAYWQSEYQKQIPKRKRRETPKTGLVLTGNGLSINVDKGRLIIKDGFTHYPQKAARFEFFKRALDIPPRIAIVDGKGSITLDALAWRSEQNVDLNRGPLVERRKERLKALHQHLEVIVTVKDPTLKQTLWDDLKKEALDEKSTPLWQGSYSR